MANSQEWVEHDQIGAEAMYVDAVFGQPSREARGMRPFPQSVADRLVGNEPVVPSAAQVAFERVSPSFDVRLVAIWDAERQAIQARSTVLCQMEHIFVAVIHESL